jgi:hypothetical protein
MTVPQLADSNCRLDVEPGGWLRLMQPMPNLDKTPPDELLKLADGLAGNLRYALQGERVWRVDEIRTPDVGLFYDQACARLLGRLLAAPGGTAVDDRLVEAVLAGSGLPWSKRDAAWVVPAASGRPQEIRVSLSNQGVRVEAVLSSWTRISTAGRQAVADFLCRSQFGFRFCRAAMDDTSVRVVSSVEDVEFAEAELLDALGSVEVSCRLLAHEPLALLSEELAEAYAALPKRT